MLLCARVWSRLWPLRRRPCSLPLLLVPAVCLLYHLLAGGRSEPGPELMAPGPSGPPGVPGSGLDRLLEEVQRDGAGPLVDWLDRLERGRRVRPSFLLLTNYCQVTSEERHVAPCGSTGTRNSHSRPPGYTNKAGRRNVKAPLM